MDFSKGCAEIEASAAEREEEKRLDEQYRAVKNELYQVGESERIRTRAFRNGKRKSKASGEKHIPYCELYKLIEFDSTLDETACNHLEEALLLNGNFGRTCSR